MVRTQHYTATARVQSLVKELRLHKKIYINIRYYFLHTHTYTYICRLQNNILLPVKVLQN